MVKSSVNALVLRMICDFIFIILRGKTECVKTLKNVN